LQPEPASTYPGALDHVQAELRLKIASELDQLRNELEDIGVSLCLEDEIMQRCMTHLQRLDELGQRSNWLAELVRAEDPVARVKDITLHSLAERLSS
jgi:hypothetical protein